MSLQESIAQEVRLRAEHEVEQVIHACVGHGNDEAFLRRWLLGELLRFGMGVANVTLAEVEVLARGMK